MLEPQKKSETPLHKIVKTYTLSSGSLYSSAELRMDAAHYNPELFEALSLLHDSKMRLERLENIVERVHLPPRFKRIYVGKNEGIPFLQGSHVIQFQPDDIKYLSTNSYRPFDDIIIREGWLLVTRSGTVGRVALCPEEWDGWAASEHIIRVIPDESKCPIGYLCSFLASPLGKIQLVANIHGAVVDELTDNQIRQILVPLPETDEDKRLMIFVDTAMKRGVGLKSQAALHTQEGIQEIKRRFL